MSLPTVPLESSGSVDIKELVLISSDMKAIDVLDYLSEINLFEDIYKPTMHGSMLFIDSRNLFKEFNIVGEEYLYINFVTPQSKVNIEKLFRIYGVKDRQLLNDKASQSYVLEFVSVESIQNTINPLFRTFSGKISDVVINIFNEFLKINRNPIKENNGYNFVDNASEFFVIPTLNDVKFVSPGWSPFKCINWCASKAIPESGDACNFLFFETNKAFMFINLETLFDINVKDPATSIGTYSYNVNAFKKNQDPNIKIFNINDLIIKKNFNHLESYSNGYYGNRLLSLNIRNKQVTLTDYDTINRYENYVHTEGDKTTPFFKTNTARTTLSDIKFNPIHPGLHNIEGNANERMPDIYGNRKANLLEMNQLKLEIFVPGRTDIEVGRMLKLNYPDVSPRGTEDQSSENLDKKYSGNYLITAINHKINTQSHMMSMEIVKDGLNG